MMQVPLASADATAGSGTSVTVRVGQHDMVVDHGAAGPKPLELMTASLAACSAMTTRTYLGRLGERGDVEVVVTLDGGPPTLLYRRVLLPSRLSAGEAHELADALERTELTMMLRPSFTIRTVVEHDGEALN